VDTNSNFKQLAFDPGDVCFFISLDNPSKGWAVGEINEVIYFLDFF
jgi:hypothetical protein